MEQALGGEKVVRRSQRLTDILWQSNIILESKVHFEDFCYILQFAEDEK
jgi:hypothetical protein